MAMFNSYVSLPEGNVGKTMPYINHPPFKNFTIRWDSSHSQSWGGKHGTVPHYYRYSLKLGVRRSDLSAGLRMMMLESTHWLGMLGVGFHWGIQKIWWVVSNMFSIYWESLSQLTNSYFSEGLKPPTRISLRHSLWVNHHQPGFHWGLQWGQDACLL